ncbi:hypothetical protein [Photorhabdus bodei]|nr:hypothetical protein [Photorhabdus bodei]
MTGVSECSQQRSNLKDDGYNSNIIYRLSSTENIITGNLSYLIYSQ